MLGRIFPAFCSLHFMPKPFWFCTNFLLLMPFFLDKAFKGAL
jgi:hypothetical protein